ncbi:MAG: NAD(P)H-hydrate dehydratase [Caldimonas sp.]
MSRIVFIGSAIGRQALHGIASTRRLEATALAAVPSYTLMARAGDAVASLALAVTPHAREVIVFAGPGNNGGDGIEAAARLTELGKRATVVLVADPTRLPVDAARALARANAAGVRVVSWAEHAASATAGHFDGAAGPDLVIDALLGFAAAAAPHGDIAAAVAGIDVLAAAGAQVLAIDVPTGLDAERGRRFGDSCVSADNTLSLLTLKPGLFTAEGRDRAGRVWLATLADAATDADAGDPSQAEERDVDAWLVGIADETCATIRRRQASHKGSFGDVAVVGGALGMTGAAWLAARAAQAAGAGRVFVDLLDCGAGSMATPDPRRPELMLRRDWWRGPVENLSAATVVCGCGGGDAVRAALPRLLASAPRLVLDADALNAVASDSSLQTLLAVRSGRGQATVLTPHPLEAARLLGCDASAVQADRFVTAETLATRFRAVVVLKGSGTLIAAPGERPRVCVTGNASLASAGTGDVLAGWIGGRWSSSGSAAFDAATRAVIEHGAAADPMRDGAIRAADLVEVLYRRARRPLA